MTSWAERWRRDFPALRASRGKGVSYLDSACMSLTPRLVLQAMDEYYSRYPGCGGRSVHRWSSQVTEKVEAMREFSGHFFGGDPSGFVHVRNTTEAINIVAQGLDLHRGDVILLTDQEHNSNLVVWQTLAKAIGLRLKFLELPDDRAFDADSYRDALIKGVRLVSFFHASNLDGRLLPGSEIVESAHDAGALVLLDGSQAAPHHRLQLARLGVDYYALSLHKMLGPTGTGLLYGAPGALDRLHPLLSGGETVSWSDYESHELLPGPARFEAGLQNYAGIVGAHAALRYLEKVDFSEMAGHERKLQMELDRATRDLQLQRVGLVEPDSKGSIFSFVIPGVDSHDVALFLDAAYGVLVRSGMNCVHSWYRSRGLEGSVRASFYLYTTDREVERLVCGIRELSERVGKRASERIRASSPSRRRSRGQRATPSPGQNGSSSPRVRPRSPAGQSSR